MYPYNSWFYNPAIFSQQAYEEYIAEQRKQDYEQEQNIEV